MGIPWARGVQTRVGVHRILALAVAVTTTACFSLGASVGGTIDGAGRVDWNGQMSFGLNGFQESPTRLWRMMVDVRGYAVGGEPHIGVGMGADLVDRPLDGALGRHVGARVGIGGGLRSPKSAPDVRLSGEAGFAWGHVARHDGGDADDTIDARTLGATVEAILHTRADRWRERAQLGVRTVGELMLWVVQ